MQVANFWDYGPGKATLNINISDIIIQKSHVDMSEPQIECYFSRSSNFYKSAG